MDLALTFVTETYEHCMAEIQPVQISNQEKCLMEVWAEYDAMMTGLCTDIYAS